MNPEQIAHLNELAQWHDDRADRCNHSMGFTAADAHRGHAIFLRALASSPSQPALVELVARARQEVLDRHPCNSMHIEALNFFVAAIMLLADTPSISKAAPKLRSALRAAAPALGEGER